jgi:hypothetical protein
MSEARLQDKIQRGLGRAARVIGAWCDAYRPADNSDPLQPKNRFLRLKASFSPQDTRYSKPAGYGEPAWSGIFDAAYTRAGDYIVRAASKQGANDGGVWFIAAQQPLLPVLCVRATRIVSAARPAAPGAAGVSGYGGVTVATATPLFTAWPASMRAAGGSGLDQVDLPADAPPGAWSVLLPTIPGVLLRTGDLITDDLARTAVVSSAELTDLGWRLLVKQVST